MAHGWIDARRLTSVRAGVGLLCSSERRIHGIVGLALLLGVVYLTWRVGATLDGVVRWLAFPLIGAEIWGFLQLTALAFQAWSVPSERELASDEEPDTSVLVLGANASPAAIERSVMAAQQIAGDRPVVVTDPANRTDVASLVARHKALYAVTYDTLEAGLRAAGGEFVLVLQGGQVPLADVFDSTLGYFAAPDVAVVQCRTGLANTDALTYVVNGRSEEALFNEVLGPALGASGDTPWGGSASVVRSDALASIELAKPLGGASQAVRTTIRLRAAGYKVRFHPEPLVQAVRPDTLDGYLNRGHRRAFANLRVLATAENPLIARRLPLRSRLVFLCAISRYFSGLHRFVLLAVLAGTLASGQLPLSASLSELAVLWLPAHILGGLAGLALGRGTLALGDRTRHSLRSMEAYCGAALRALTPVLPTRPRRRALGNGRGLRALGRLALLTAVALALDVLLIMRGATAWGSDVLPGFDGREVYAVLIVGVLALAPITDVLQLLVSRRKESRRFRHPTNLAARVGAAEARVVDVTPRGLGIELAPQLATQLPRGNALAVDVDLPQLDGSSMTARLKGLVRHVSAGEESSALGVEVTETDPEQPDALGIYYWVTRPTRVSRGLDEAAVVPGDATVAAPGSREPVGSGRARGTLRVATTFAVVMVAAAFPSAGF